MNKQRQSLCKPLSQVSSRNFSRTASACAQHGSARCLVSCGIWEHPWCAPPETAPWHPHQPHFRFSTDEVHFLVCTEIHLFELMVGAIHSPCPPAKTQSHIILGRIRTLKPPKLLLRPEVYGVI